MDSYLLRILPLLALFLVSIWLNGYIRARVAYMLGDVRPKIEGRMSWNPLPHIDLIGLLSLLVFYAGWAKPLSVSYNDLGRKRWAIPAIELSGFLTNFLVGIGFAILFLLFKSLEPPTNLDLRWLKNALEFVATFNVFLALFSLLPIPQLPGFRALTGLIYHKPQGILDSQALTYMGYAIIFILVIWTPILDWVGSATIFFLRIFGMTGKPFLGLFAYKFFGGF